MITDDAHILIFGKSLKENKIRFPTIKCIYYRDTPLILFGHLTISPYMLDCGSVLFHHCYCASDKDITDAIDFCSFNGFDKIFHTHTSPNEEYFNNFKDKLINLGFYYIPAGYSNRNPKYFCGIFVYHIPKCESTGYNF